MIGPNRGNTWPADTSAPFQPEYAPGFATDPDSCDALLPHKSNRVAIHSAVVEQRVYVEGMSSGTRRADCRSNRLHPSR